MKGYAAPSGARFRFEVDANACGALTWPPEAYRFPPGADRAVWRKTIASRAGGGNRDAAYASPALMAENPSDSVYSATKPLAGLYRMGAGKSNPYLCSGFGGTRMAPEKRPSARLFKRPPGRYNPLTRPVSSRYGPSGEVAERLKATAC